jgi:hypothetical protein
VPAKEFRFGMTLSATGDSHLLVDVVRSMLAHVGLKGDARDRLIDEIVEQRRAAPAGACTVHVTARSGEVEITFAQSGRDFKTSCPVPLA